MKPDTHVDSKNYINEQDDTMFKIDIASATLDRSINFIVSCDNKTSIVLAITSAVLTIVLSNVKFSSYKVMLNFFKENCTFCYFVFFIALIGSIATVVYGFYSLVSVLVATIKVSNKPGAIKSEVCSRIFFGGIVQYKNLQNYSKSFSTMSQKEILNELIQEIYINSYIADKKYYKYNLGLKLVTIGITFLVVTLMIGAIYTI